MDTKGLTAQVVTQVLEIRRVLPRRKPIQLSTYTSMDVHVGTLICKVEMGAWLKSGLGLRIKSPLVGVNSRRSIHSTLKDDWIPVNFSLFSRFICIATLSEKSIQQN